MAHFLTYTSLPFDFLNMSLTNHLLCYLFVLCCCLLPKKLIMLFNNASWSQCIIDGEVLNRKDRVVFYHSTAAFERGKDHKSCLWFISGKIWQILVKDFLKRVWDLLALNRFWETNMLFVIRRDIKQVPPAAAINRGFTNFDHLWVNCFFVFIIVFFSVAGRLWCWNAATTLHWSFIRFFFIYCKCTWSTQTEIWKFGNTSRPVSV